MIVSWNWLAQYVRLDMPVEALAERLALTGLNHEGTAEVGGDLAIDLEVTSNRPDCLSHIGVAREVSVLFGARLVEPDPWPKTSGPPVETMTGVTVETPELCPRFTARVVSGLSVGDSPWWLRKRLETLGVRPISNVVDVTNYVLFECGQPLHAYDLDRLAEHRLIVRKAHANETLRAINGKDYDLSAEMLVIADAERPVGLAGVMGGLDTEIEPGTMNIVIESARFDPMSVRRTARALGLFSPSSYRFERPMDPERTEWASRRCADLILETAGGTLHPGVIDVGPAVAERPAVTLRLSQIPRVLGIEIDPETVDRILRALGLTSLPSQPDSLSFRPPSWRADLEREIDLIEDVARIHGYEHIPEDCPVPLARSAKRPRERIETEIRSALTGMGFDEAVTFSLVADDLATPIEPGPALPPIRVEHSNRKRESALRQSLAPSLLAARAHNEAHGTHDADLFEIAHVYLPRSDVPLPAEPPRLALVFGGDFLALKGVIEALLDRLHAGTLEARPLASSWFAPGRAAELRLKGKRLGMLGEIDRARLDQAGLREACSAAELSLEVLIEQATLIPEHRPLPPFPAVARDLSLVVARALPWAELANAATAAAGPTLEALRFLDTFDLPDDRHSVHFGLRFRGTDRTLTGEEVEAAIQAVVDVCASRFGATLRT